MNKLFSKIIGASLAIAMMIGVGAGMNASKVATEANAATNADWEKVTGALTAGTEYLIVSVNDNKCMQPKNSSADGTTTASTGGYSATTFSNSSAPANGFIFADAGNGKFYIKDGVNFVYAAGTTNNGLGSKDTAGATDSVWTATDTGSGTYTLITDSSRQLSEYSTNWRVYGTTSGSRTNVHIYQKATGSTDPTLVFSEETIDGEVGDAFSFTYTANNLTEDITWSPASNATDVINYTVNENTNTVSGTLTGVGTVVLAATSGSVSDSITFNVSEHITKRRYTIKSTSSVDESGDTMTDAVASFSNNYTTKEQLTKDKEMVLSITGLSKRVTINKLVFSMRSNGSAGSGYASISIDGKTPSYLSGDENGVSFEEFGDEGTAYGTSYRNITWDGLSYSAISSITIKIHATVNSLYCEWFEIYFTEEDIVDTVTALSASPNTWVGYDSQTINVADYTISVTKNGADGTSSDYEFQGIGNGEGDNFQPRVANFTSGHPALTDTRLQWKANYPTEAGGSTYLYAYVSLSVSEDTAVSVALSGNMSKTTYLSTENWDKAGLVVTATYASSAEANVTADSSFEFYSDAAMTEELAAPADLGFGENKTVYVKATYSGLSNAEAYEQTVNVSKAISVTFVAGTDVGSLTEVSKNGISISAAATESDFSRNDNYRIYSGKNVTINANRENIVKIEFISNSEANNTLSGEGLTKNGATSIWTGDADSVTLTAEGSQARYTKIIVTLDSVKYSIKSTLKTKTSLSYATYTHHDDGTYTYTDVAIRFGGKIAPALWNNLNAESTIEGYGVLLATGDLGTDSIEDWYNAYKTESNTVDEALDELVTDGVVAKYSKSVQEKAHPTQVGDVYSWNLYYRIGNSKAELLEEYTAVAYIKIHNSIVFLKQDTVSAKSLASDMLQGENPETYGGSLSYLAELQEGE